MQRAIIKFELPNLPDSLTLEQVEEAVTFHLTGGRISQDHPAMDFIDLSDADWINVKLEEEK